MELRYLEELKEEESSDRKRSAVYMVTAVEKQQGQTLVSITPV